MINDEKIDFVILWVDGNDIKWQEERSKYVNNKSDKNIVRFRDWSLLKYWFRSVDKYANWVNNIYFITYGHIPEWLNTNAKNLKIIKHSDFIPKKYLPTFNSNVIELNLNRIDNLSDKFVLFNDDVYLFDYVKKDDFFCDNKVKDIYLENPIIATYDPYNYTQYNNLSLINKMYDKKIYIKNRKYYNLNYGVRSIASIIESKHEKFVGFYNQHITQPYLKKYFNKVWESNYKLCDDTCMSKFRNCNNISHYAIRYIQMLDGDFIPRKFNFGKSFELSNNNEILFNQFKKSNYKVICINDSDETINFDKIKNELIELFEKKFPKKSKYER